MQRKPDIQKLYLFIYFFKQKHPNPAKHEHFNRNNSAVPRLSEQQFHQYNLSSTHVRRWGQNPNKTTQNRVKEKKISDVHQIPNVHPNHT